MKPGASPLLKGCLILLAIVVVGGTLAAILLGSALSGFLDRFGSDLDDPEAPCAFLSDDDVRAVLGDQAQGHAMNALTRATLGLVLDMRVLATAPDCWLTADESAPLGRAARYEGGDAAAVFDTERENAREVRNDQGGGITLIREGYEAAAAPGLGDEAFCTGISPAIQAGVVARSGNRVVYVSLSGPGDGTVLDMQPNAAGVIYSPTLCQRAAELVRRALD